jgi:phospholipase C
MSPNRRQFLAGGVVGAAALLGGCGGQSSGATREPSGPPPLRAAGSRPRPDVAPGTESHLQIEHVVVVMMENHSFDNILGLIGRGDGFTLDADGRPTAKNPDGKGGYVHAFHMPTECQTYIGE